MAGEPQLQFGDEGLFVARLQRALASAGFDAGVIDGLFRDQTGAAVEELQAAVGLVVDGVVGTNTWSNLPTHAVRVHAKFMSVPQTVTFGRMVREMRASFAMVNIGVELASTEVLPRQDLLDNIVLENGPFGAGETSPEQDILYSFDSFVGQRDIAFYFINSITTLGGENMIIAPTHPPNYPAITMATYRDANPPFEFNPGVPYALGTFVGKLCGLGAIDQFPDCLPGHLMSVCLFDDGVADGPAVLTEAEGQTMLASPHTILIDEPPGD